MKRLHCFYFFSSKPWGTSRENTSSWTSQPVQGKTSTCSLPTKFVEKSVTGILVPGEVVCISLHIFPPVLLLCWTKQIEKQSCNFSRMLQKFQNIGTEERKPRCDIPAPVEAGSESFKMGTEGKLCVTPVTALLGNGLTQRLVTSFLESTSSIPSHPSLVHHSSLQRELCF